MRPHVVFFHHYPGHHPQLSIIMSTGEYGRSRLSDGSASTSSPASSAEVAHRAPAIEATTTTVEAVVDSEASVDAQLVTAELIKRHVLAAMSKLDGLPHGPFRVTVPGVPCDITNKSIREDLERECCKLHLTYDGNLNKMIVQFMPSECHEIGGAGLGSFIFRVMDMNLFEALWPIGATSTSLGPIHC
jgi:hypothetical protein